MDSGEILYNFDPQLTLAKITDNLALQRIRPALRNPRQGDD